jgi:hypothetical protein
MTPRRGFGLAVLLLAGCSAAAPFATFPLQPPPGAVDTRIRVAVCYNGLESSADKLQELAQVQCFGDAKAERIDTDYRLDTCPLSAPGRATFVCTPQPAPGKK